MINLSIAKNLQNKFIKESDNETNFPRARLVYEYAIDLLDEFIDDYEAGEEFTEENFLNGSLDWKHYSKEGMSLVYDDDIKDRFKVDSSLDSYSGDLLDAQAVLLERAWKLIERNVKKYKR